MTSEVLLWKRLESGVFRWPPVTDGVMRLSATQLAALLDGLDWSRMHVPRLGRPKTAQYVVVYDRQCYKGRRNSLV